jgi:hypothetical protein
MFRRLLFFGFGVLISIFFLSMGPENRLKNTFYAYIDYFNMDKRVISHLVNDKTLFTDKAECQLRYFNISKDEILGVLNDGNVNFGLSDQKSEPCQYFVIENSLKGDKVNVEFELCYNNNKSVRVMKFYFDNQIKICDNLKVND